MGLGEQSAPVVELDAERCRDVAAADHRHRFDPLPDGVFDRRAQRLHRAREPSSQYGDAVSVPPASALRGDFELADESAAQRQQVVRNRDHPETLLEPLAGERSAGVDARDHAVATTRVDDRREGIVEDRLTVVVARLEPEAQREVGGTDVDGVDARHRHDVVEVAECFDRLDHRDHGD